MRYFENNLATMRTILIILAMAAASATAQEELFAYATLQSNDIALTPYGDLRFVQYTWDTPVRVFGDFVGFTFESFEIYVHECSILDRQCSSTGPSRQIVDNEFGKVAHFIGSEEGTRGITSITGECMEPLSLELNRPNSIIGLEVVVHFFRDPHRYKLIENGIACGIVWSHERDRYQDENAYAILEPRNARGTHLGYLYFQQSTPNAPVRIFSDFVGRIPGVFEIVLIEQAYTTEPCFSRPPVVINDNNVQVIAQFRIINGKKSTVTDECIKPLTLTPNTPNSIINLTITISRYRKSRNLACGVVISGRVPITTMVPTTTASRTSQKQARYAYASIESNNSTRIHFGDLRFVQYSPDTPVRAFGDFVGFERNSYEIVIHEHGNVEPDCSSTGSSHKFGNNKFGKITDFISDEGKRARTTKQCKAPITLAPSTSNSIIDRAVVIHYYYKLNDDELKENGDHITSVACGVVKLNEQAEPHRYQDVNAYVEMRYNNEWRMFLGFLRFQQSAPDAPVRIFGDFINLARGFYLIFVREKGNTTEQCVSNEPAVVDENITPVIHRFHSMNERILSTTGESSETISIVPETPNTIVGRAITIRRFDNDRNIACGVVISGQVPIATMASSPPTSPTWYAFARIESNNVEPRHFGDLRFVQYYPDSPVRVFGDFVGFETDVYDIVIHVEGNMTKRCFSTGRALTTDFMARINFGFTRRKNSSNYITDEFGLPISIVPNTTNSIIDRAAVVHRWYGLKSQELITDGNHGSSVACGVVLRDQVRNQDWNAYVQMMSSNGATNSFGYLRLLQTGPDAPIRVFGDFVGLEHRRYRIFLHEKGNTVEQCASNEPVVVNEITPVINYFFPEKGRKSWITGTFGASMSIVPGTPKTYIVDRAISIRLYSNNKNVACGVVRSMK